jgi:glycosyltransferase involved in cell wall biosynthesis
MISKKKLNNIMSNKNTKSQIAVGYLTSLDPNDKTSWSGTHFRMLKALESNFQNVQVLGPIPQSETVNKILRKINSIHHFLFGKKFDKGHNIVSSLYYASVVKKRIKNIDVLFVPSSSNLIAFLKTTIPICTLEDATYNQILGYYPNYKNFSNLSILESKYVIKRAMNRTKTFVYCSEWSVNDAINNYKVPTEKVFKVKLGANIDSVPLRDKVLNRDYSSTINLLFLGKDWARKGGDLVVKTYNLLLEEGYDVTLTVCGCIPPENQPGVKVIPFLDKNIKKDFDSFNKILFDSHVLFVPTRSECYGIVFCEAGAFGMPVITTDTGGVTEIVKNGINGFALPIDAEASSYVSEIKEILNDRLLMKQMAINSRDLFEEELNWEFWGNEIKKILLSTVKK